MKKLFGWGEHLSEIFVGKTQSELNVFFHNWNLS